MDDESLLDSFPCPRCRKSFTTRKGLKIHFNHVYMCKERKKNIDSGSSGAGVSDMFFFNDDEDRLDSDEDEEFVGPFEDTDLRFETLFDDNSSKQLYMKSSHWNELWLLNFCLKHNLGRDAQNTLRNWALSVSMHFFFVKPI